MTIVNVKERGKSFSVYIEVLCDISAHLYNSLSIM